MNKKVALAGIGLVLLIGVGWLWRTLSVRPAESMPTAAAVSTKSADEQPARSVGAGELSRESEQRAPAAEASPKPDTGASTPDHPVQSEAKRLPSTLLHIRAADTGRELTGVELVRGMNLDSSGSSCPGPYPKRDVLASAVTSPIHLGELEKLDPEAGAQPYYARAEHYAWGRIEIDLALGSEHELLLPPGGALAIELTGSIPPPDVAVLLVRPSASPRADAECIRRLDSRTSFALESLAAGSHFVSAELTGSTPSIPALAFGEVEIVAGSTAHLVLTLREIPHVDEAPLEGVVVIPKEWGIAEFRMMAYPLGVTNPMPSGGVPTLESKEMRAIESQPEAHVFSWPAVPLGSYELVVIPPGWSMTVNVGPSGMRNAHIEVPPPALVSVRVVEVGLGTDVEISELGWNSIRPEGFHGGHAYIGYKNSTTGRFEFSAPIGDVELTVADSDYLPFSKRVTVESGRNDITIEIVRACGIQLELKNGTVSVPFDDSNVSIGQVGGPGQSNWNTTRRQGMRFAVTNPGRYRVEIRAPSGYRAIEPFPVDVEAGKFVEIVVQVERAP
jgi:hypothetical protein